MSQAIGILDPISEWSESDTVIMSQRARTPIDLFDPTDEIQSVSQETTASQRRFEQDEVERREWDIDYDPDTDPCVGGKRAPDRFDLIEDVAPRRASSAPPPLTVRTRLVIVKGERVAKVAQEAV